MEKVSNQMVNNDEGVEKLVKLKGKKIGSLIELTLTGGYYWKAIIIGYSGGFAQLFDINYERYVWVASDILVVILKQP